MRWTDEEDERLAELRQQGYSTKDIAARLGRTPKSVTRHEEYRNSDTKHASKPEIDKSCQKQIIEENQRLKKQIAILHQHSRQEYLIDNYYDEVIRFGVIADTHLGSLYDNIDFLNLAYDVYEREGIMTVYHCGDFVEGENMYRTQVYEIRVHGADAQIEYAVNEYPYRKSITTKAIGGNHDASFGGMSIVRHIAKERPDIRYLADDYADIELNSDAGKATMRLIHPSGGTAYAISYKAQKGIESLTGGEKPHIMASGHFHKSLYMPGYRNVEYFEAGCIQKQTPYMRRKQTPAMVGFWIVELVLNEDGIARCKGEFIPWYAK